MAFEKSAMSATMGAHLNFVLTTTVYLSLAVTLLIAPSM